MSPSGESSKQGVVWGTPGTICNSYLFYGNFFVKSGSQYKWTYLLWMTVVDKGLDPHLI